MRLYLKPPSRHVKQLLLNLAFVIAALLMWGKVNAQTCVTVEDENGSMQGYFLQDSSFVNCTTNELFSKRKWVRIIKNNCYCPPDDLTSLPSISFKSGSARLNNDAQAILTVAGQRIRTHPADNVKVVGYVTEVNKRAQQLSYDRVYAVVKFLVENVGISERRLIFTYDNRGSGNSVDLMPTKEAGSYNIPPPPAPNFRSNH